MTATVNAVKGTASRYIPGVGRLDFAQTDRRREYWLLPDGGQRRRRLPSVTTILGDTWSQAGLLNWYKREPNAAALLMEGQDRGKAVHRWVESAMGGTVLPFSDFEADYRPWVQAAARFMFEHQPEAIDIERLVCHPELGYAGRLDLLAMLDGQRTLLDFKTSAGGNVYAKAHVQTWAYALADERCGGDPIERRVVVGLSGDGSYRIVESPAAGELWECCIALSAAQKAFLRLLGEERA